MKWIGLFLVLSAFLASFGCATKRPQAESSTSKFAKKVRMTDEHARFMLISGAASAIGKQREDIILVPPISFNPNSGRKWRHLFATAIDASKVHLVEGELVEKQDGLGISYRVVGGEESPILEYKIVMRDSRNRRASHVSIGMPLTYTITESRPQ